MDSVAQALAAYSWPYTTQDPAACAEIATRAASAGRAKTLITYSELVSGIDFHIPSVNNGRPFRLGWVEQTNEAYAFYGRRPAV